MTSWKRSSNSNFAAIPQQFEARYVMRSATNLHLQIMNALDGGCLVHRIPWQRGTTFNDICILYTNYVTRRYGHAIIAFDGYQEELSTKYGAHERRTGGRTGSTVDFTRDMVMKSKKETC